MITRWWRLILILVLAAPLPAGLVARPEIYSYESAPLPGETYTTAWFRIHVPDTPQTLRGVYFYVDPLDGDSRAIVQNGPLLALCEELEFGLMGARLDNVRMESGIGNAVLRALTAFADSSARPELAHSTLFFDGWSWGGQFSYHFTRWRPERVIGFMTMKGGYHDTTAAGAAVLVPGYLFIGELDLPYRITNLTGIFEAHRPLGARWILAMEPGAGHGRVTDRALLDPFVREVCRRRLPAVIDPHSPVTLREIPEPSSWLGDRESDAIGAFACYPGDPGQACWCPARDVAAGWQAFVSDSAVTDTFPCDPAAAGQAPPRESRLCAAPNPSGWGVTLAFDAPRAGDAEVRVYSADGRCLRCLPCPVAGPGMQRIPWDGCDDRGRPVGSGVFVVRVTLPPDLWSTRVVRLPD